MKKHAVTLHDIARRARVSHVTVSNVLNRRGQEQRVSERKAGQIRELARQMGYRPNYAARSLRMGGGKIVLGIIENWLSPSATKRIRAFGEALQKRGYGFLMQLLVGINETEKLDLFEKLLAIGDGLIIFELALGETASVARFQAIIKNAPPAITPTGSIPQAAINYTRVNWGKSFGLIGTHYRQLGHARIGLCCREAERSLHDIFKKEMAKLGLGVECFCAAKELSERGYYEAGADIARQWLAIKNPPKALYCTFDEIALSLMENVRKHGVRIPEDLAVIGGGDSEFCEWLQPPLTTLTHSEDELAELAVSDLVRRIEKGERIPGTGKCAGIIRQKLVVRESCGGKRFGG